jgi:hypothetical protein
MSYFAPLFLMVNAGGICGDFLFIPHMRDFGNFASIYDYRESPLPSHDFLRLILLKHSDSWQPGRQDFEQVGIGLGAS